MKISATTGQIQRQNIIPETPPKQQKQTKYKVTIDAPRAHNPYLVCDLATRQSHELTN